MTFCTPRYDRGGSSVSKLVTGYRVGGFDITAERDEYFGTKDGDEGNSVIGFTQYPSIVLRSDCPAESASATVQSH